MKKLIIVLFLACLTLPMLASEKVRMGVFDLEYSNISKDTAVAVSEMLRAELFSTGRFIIVDKKNMDKILKEQAFQQTGCTSSECAVEVGKILNVNIMATGTINKLGNNFNLSVTLTDVEKGESLMMEKGACDTEDKLSNEVKKISFSIAIKTPVSGKVVRVSSPESVVLDLGASDNVRQGMRFQVSRVKEEIKDSTGRVIMKEYEDVGEIELTEVQKDASRAKFFNKKTSVLVGDIVKVSEAVLSTGSDTTKLIQQMQQMSGSGSSGGSFIDPAWRSLLFPGLGQFYNKQDLKGWIFLIAGAAGTVGTVSKYLDYSRKYDDYNKMTDPSRIAELEDKYQLANTAYREFTNNARVLAIVWGLNLVDSVISYNPQSHASDKNIQPNGMFCESTGIDSVKLGYTVKW